MRAARVVGKAYGVVIASLAVTGAVCGPTLPVCPERSLREMLYCGACGAIFGACLPFIIPINVIGWVADNRRRWIEEVSSRIEEE